MLPKAQGFSGNHFGTSRTTSSSASSRPNNFVYYPEHEVYYNPGSSRYSWVEDGSWVTSQAPRDIPAQRVLASRAMSIDGYESPSQHYAEYVQADRGYVERRTTIDTREDAYPRYRRVQYRR